MAGAARDRHRNGAPFPQGIDPTSVFEAFMQRIEHLGNQNNRLMPPLIVLPPPPPRQTDKLLERLHALHPNKFDGMAEPWRVEQWHREIEVILDTIECNEHDKHHLASFYLPFATLDW